MPKIFPIIVRRGATQVVEVPGASESDVTKELLRYDLPEVHPEPMADHTGIVVSAEDPQPAPAEESVIGLLVRDELEHPAPAESIESTLHVAAFAGHPGPTDEQTLLMRAFIDHPEALEMSSLHIVRHEISPEGIESVLVSLDLDYDIVHPDPLKSMSSVIVQHTDAPAADDLVSIVAYSNRFVNATVSNSNWSNPTDVNANTNTFADLTAASSGIGGVTSNTVSGDLRRRHGNFGLATWLTDITLLRSFVEIEVLTNGVPVGGSIDMAWRWMRGDGGQHVITAAAGNVAKQVFLATVSSEHRTWAKVNDSHFRGDGILVSGTGLGVSRVARWYRAWLEIQAERLLA